MKLQLAQRGNAARGGGILVGDVAVIAKLERVEAAVPVEDGEDIAFVGPRSE